MLPIVYGSFLRKSDVKRYKLEMLKPRLMLLGSCFIAFSLAAALVEGAFWGYEAYFNKPVKTHEEDVYKEYQKLNTELLKLAAREKAARPNGMDVNKVLQSFATAKREDLVLTSLEITPKRYFANCQSKQLEAVNSYVNSLNFGVGKTIALGNIAQKKDFVEFSVEVTDTKPEQQPGKGGVKK